MQPHPCVRAAAPDAPPVRTLPEPRQVVAGARGGGLRASGLGAGPGVESDGGAVRQRGPGVVWQCLVEGSAPVQGVCQGDGLWWAGVGCAGLGKSGRGPLTTAEGCRRVWRRFQGCGRMWRIAEKIQHRDRYIPGVSTGLYLRAPAGPARGSWTWLPPLETAVEMACPTSLSPLPQQSCPAVQLPMMAMAAGPLWHTFAAWCMI